MCSRAIGRNAACEGPDNPLSCTVLILCAPLHDNKSVSGDLCSLLSLLSAAANIKSLLPNSNVQNIKK